MKIDPVILEMIIKNQEKNAEMYNTHLTFVTNSSKFTNLNFSNVTEPRILLHWAP